MSSIPLIFSPDRRAAAAQLAEALGSAGFPASLEAVAAEDGEAIARKASGAPAALLLWSRSLAAGALVGGWLGAVRRLPNFVEVSLDGIASESGDDSRVILLSGWRGQPFHLGWQRLLAELERLGPRGARPTSARSAAPSVRSAAAEAPAVPPQPGATEARPPRRLLVPALVGAVLVAAIGAVSWFGRTGDEAALVTRAQMTPATPPVATGPSKAAPPLEAAMPAPAPMRAPTAPAAAAVAPARPAPAGASPRRTAQAAAGPRSKKVRAGAAELPIKRYSKRHSKTMRRFCARSGRSTPQCRIYLRSVSARRS